MKNSRKLLFIAVALGSLAFVGCSTPSTRIQGNPEAFARLTPEQQALVKAGQIAVGFDMEAVKLALGAPDRVTLHTTAAGQTQVWHYVTYEASDGTVIYTGYYHRRWGWRGGPGWWGPGYAYEVATPARVHDRFRVAFDRNGRVASIQEELP